jgi:hypothetical protein
LIFQVEIADDETRPADDEDHQQPGFFFVGQCEPSAQPDDQFFENERSFFHQAAEPTDSYEEVAILNLTSYTNNLAQQRRTFPNSVNQGGLINISGGSESEKFQKQKCSVICFIYVGVSFTKISSLVLEEGYAKRFYAN